MHTQTVLRLPRFALLAFTLMSPVLAGCGSGSRVVTNLAFTDEVVGGDLYAGIDATLASGGLSLPAAKFPLYNPKNPSQVLGEVETRGDHVLVRVNASEALRLPGLADGTKLPSGAAIPLDLPAGLTPVGIPAFNSNSRVYVAVNGKQIMVGVAVSILKEDGLKLPISLFLPFTINSQVSGTGGFYLGEQQGLAVFALKDGVVSPTIAIGSRLAAESVSSKGRIEIRNETITRSKLKKFMRARDRIREIRLD